MGQSLYRVISISIRDLKGDVGPVEALSASAGQPSTSQVKNQRIPSRRSDFQTTALVFIGAAHISTARRNELSTFRTISLEATLRLWSSASCSGDTLQEKNMHGRM
eukprot:s2783_g2.t1